MTPNEAEIILQLNNFDDIDDAVEYQLFELRKQLINKALLPQLLVARKTKLKQLKQAAEILDFEFIKSNNQLILNSLNKINLIEAFNNYQENKTKILKQLSSELSFENFENCIDLLELNLRNWCKLWPKLELENSKEILLSKELESMRFYEILKGLELKNVQTFDLLESLEIPIELQIEIVRLNKIRNFFS